jgi:uncharacterized protein (DUF1697 family)
VPVVISLLRGVNVGGRHLIKMDALRALYVSLKLEDVRTHLQSGNVIFRTKEKNLPKLAAKIQAAIERDYGFRPEIMLRTPADFRQAIAATPFPASRNLHPSKIIVTFLGAEPAAEARAALEALKPHPEEVHLKGRDLYIYFPDGMGQSRLWSAVEKMLKTAGTARNWNSVTKVLAIAEEMESEPTNARERSPKAPRR